MVEWRAVEGWEGLYDVSSAGEVYSHRSKRILRPVPAGAGYVQVTLRGLPLPRIREYIHRLVVIAFIGDMPIPGYEINHKNGIKTDNRLENLEWRTHQGNLQHAVAHRLLSAGRRARKLTPDEVRLIRGSRVLSNTALAKRLGVTRVVLSQIREGLTYRDV